MPPDKVNSSTLALPHESSAVPDPREIADARQQLGILPEDFAIGTVTRLHESKGNSYLIDAARIVIDQKPNARFVRWGRARCGSPLKLAPATRPGRSFPPFRGICRAMSRVLSAFDLSVFPSLWEGTPLTMFEALAAGKPIVATDADGLVDVLEDGRDARIVPKRHAQALADAIVALMNDPQERARLAGGARITAQQYDIGAFVRKMEQLYGRLCNGSRGDLSFLA